MRRGPWKLPLTGSGQEPGKAELYQLETGIAERFNVAAAHPAIVAQSRDAMRRQSSFQPAPSRH